MDIPQAIVGPQGQKLLFYRGYTYTMKARKNAIRVRWICHHYKKYNCKGTITTDNTLHTTVMSSAPHCHPPNEEDLDRFKKCIELKKLAHKLLDENVKPGDLVDDSFTYKSGRSKRGEVSVASLKRRLRKDRERLKKLKLKESELMLNPETRVTKDPHESVISGVTASQHQVTPVPSTSGVVPKPSAISAPSQTSAKPYVSVVSEVKPSPSVVPKPLAVPEPEPEPLPPAEDDSSISVKWNTYATNMSSVMPSLLEDEKFVDVTLACDGKYIKCHKVILGACSAYFEELLSINPCQHPIILMRDFQFWEIQAIVDFIYRGVVNIPQHKLPKLLQVASILQIKGLTGATNDTGSNPDDTKPTEDSRKSKLEGSSALRKRPELSSGPGTKTSETPVKKKKLIRKSSRNPLEPNMSDESSSQSDGHNASLSQSPDPYSLLHSVCIKEETPDYDVDDPSHDPYSYDQNVAKLVGSSELGQFQLLTLPESREIKEERNDELFNPTDEDPLESESGIS